MQHQGNTVLPCRNVFLLVQHGYMFQFGCLVKKIQSRPTHLLHTDFFRPHSVFMSTNSSFPFFVKICKISRSLSEQQEAMDRKLHNTPFVSSAKVAFDTQMGGIFVILWQTVCSNAKCTYLHPYNVHKEMLMNGMNMSVIPTSKLARVDVKNFMN